MWPGYSLRSCGNRTKPNDFQWKEGRFRLGIRKKFFVVMVKVMKCWNGLPKEAVAAPSMEVFKARLDGALSNPI